MANSVCSIPRGTFDILPAVSYKWQYLTDIFRKTAKAFNYKEIVTPIFEQSQLFERGVGEGTDIIEKEIYKFPDRKGRILALRPEGTAPVVRSYIENNLGQTSPISKLYYTGPMFRYDRPQKGRYRQFYQYGIELIASASPYYDAEVISFADSFLKKCGLSDYSLEINSIGCNNCSSDYDQALISYLNDYKEKLCPDCIKRMDKNPKRVLDCKIKGCREIMQDAPSMLDYLDKECKKDFESVKKYLTELGIDYIVNPKIVRGLDYYNKTAFEFIHNNSALIGGGRYDGLISQLGGNPTPAIGFAGGFERLINAMESAGLSFGSIPKPTYYLVTMSNEALDYGIKLCSQLRDCNIPVEFDIEKTSLKAQMKAADRSGASYSLIIGEDEIKNSTISVKNLADGTQVNYSLNDFIDMTKSNKVLLL